MNNIVIKAENLGKIYRIGSAEDREKTFREAITDMAAAPFRRIRNAFSSPVSNDVNPSEFIWALKDVNFEVKRGEIVGIIGRNGAGKSTLLKILARITEPTEGKVILRGRVGSLLEVGTGFHSELTGEENIYLSGTILGMNSNEISRKFDEIVAFAGIERFIHTPVKYYSSGMYMRLAFAVAAHLETEILLIDEVLAVGDAVFQTKCLAKMKNITGEGHTVLFVSHNMAAVGSICDRGVVLDAGRILIDSGMQNAINYYEKDVFQNKYLSKPIIERTDRSGTGDIILTSFRIEDEEGRKIDRLPNGHTVKLVFDYRTRDEKGAKNVDLGILVERESGERVFQLGTRFTGQQFPYLGSKGSLTCTIKRFPLVPGRYRLGTYFQCGSAAADYITALTYLNVVDGDFYGSNYQIYENETRILIDGTWAHQE